MPCRVRPLQRLASRALLARRCARPNRQAADTESHKALFRRAGHAYPFRDDRAKGADPRSACRPALGGQPARLRRARRRRRDHRGEACMSRALLLAVALVSTPAFATPALAPIWTDHAVIQRDRPIVIEGSAAPNATLTVTLGTARQTIREIGRAHV